MLFLKKLYELSKGSRATGLDMDGIGQELGFDYETYYDIAIYHKNNGKIVIEGKFVKLTHSGIKTVETTDLQLFEEKQQNRDSFLKLVYDKTNGSTTAQIDSFAVGKELGFDHDTMWDTTDYLAGEGFIRITTAQRHISITHRGIQKVEGT